MAFLKTSRGLNWHYELKGKGDPVLFIHGFGGSHRWWFNQVDFLANDYQVLTVDLPGHGQSEWMPMTLHELAVDLRQMTVMLGLSHMSIVASSFGGLIAFELCRLMPDHVMRMSLVGSIPKFARAPHYPAGLDIPKIRTLSRQFEGKYEGALDIFFRSLFTMKERNDPRFAKLKVMRDQEPLPRREALQSFLDILEKTDLRDRLSSLICPLQFITGQEDYMCPPSIMDWMAEHTYNARFDVIEGCGHLPFMIEAEEYNRLLEDFLIN